MPTAMVDGLRVEYTDRGFGLPLVFVPGLYGSANWFRYQTSGLSDRYRVIAYTTRSARGNVPYSLAVLSRDLIRFLDTLKIYGAVVIGHALGASIALDLAAQYPERVLAAVAVAAVPSYGGVSGEEVLEHLSPGEPRTESFLTRARNWFGRSKKVADDDSDPVAYLAQAGGHPDKATLSARLRLLLDEDITPILPKVAAPTLVIAGSDEWSCILSGSQAIDQLVPNATLEILENTGHFCFYTRHDLFNSALDEYVSREVPRL